MRISTLQLKLFTSAMMLLCCAMLIGWPSFVGQRPGKDAPLVESKAYAVKFVTYISVDVLLLLLAAIGAIAIMRRASAEYKAQQMDNMRDLIEATLLDQQKKANESSVE